MFAVLGTLGAGVAGGAAFWLLSLPAAWLSGSLVAMVILIALGLRPVMPGALRDTGMLLAGVVTGSSITMDMLRAAAKYPGSIVILVVTTAAIMLGGQALLVLAFRWDRRSAFFAAVPGALSVVVASVASIGGDMTRIIAVQAFRMIILIALLPSIVISAFPAVSTLAVGVSGAADFAVSMAAALVVALLFVRLGVMAPFLLGGIAAAGLLHIAQLVHGTPPTTVGHVGMVLVGVFAGSRFAGLDIASIRPLFVSGISLFALTSALAALGAMVAWHFVGIPLADALVAYAPGGLEAMVMLGIALGLDPLYISSHHVLRFVMVAAVLPFISRRHLR